MVVDDTSYNRLILKHLINLFKFPSSFKHTNLYYKPAGGSKSIPESGESMFEVIFATDGEQAIEQYKILMNNMCNNKSCAIGRLKLIFMDLEMPGIDGVETTKRIL